MKSLRKRKAFLMAGLIIAVLLIIISVLYFQSPSFISKRNRNNYTNTTNESRIKINQVYLTGIAGRVKSQDNTLYYYLSPSVNLEIDESFPDNTIKSVVVDNIVLTNHPSEAKYKVLFPEAIEIQDNKVDPYFGVDINEFNYNFESLPTKSMPYIYKTVDSSLAPDKGSIKNKGDLLEFMIVVYEIGNFDEKTVLQSDNKIESTKYLQYAGVTGSDIDAKLSFTVVINFDDDLQLYRDFELSVDGEQMVNQGYFSYDLKLEE